MNFDRFLGENLGISCKIGSKETNCNCSARVETQSNPEGEDCGECDGGEEVCGELVVSGSNAAEVLKPTEGVLDEVSIAIAGSIMANRTFAAGAARDHRHGAGLANGSAQRIGVISLVGQDVARLAGTRE